MFGFSKRSIDTMKGVHPDLVHFMKELIAISPYDFSIVEGVRSAETQQEYYTYGRTVFKNKWGEKITRPVTYLDGVNKKSKHQIQDDGYGHAIDIVFVGKTKEERYDPIKFIKLRKVADKLMKQYGIEWGGDWKKPKDMPHWQIRGDK